MRHQKQNSQTWAHRGASESAARESGLQLDRASTDQDHPGQGQSRSPAGRKDGHAWEERFAPRAPDSSGRPPAKGRGEKIVRRHRAPQCEPEWRIHSHRQTRQRKSDSAAVAFIEWVDAPQPTEEPAVEETGKKRKPAKEAAVTDEAKPSKKSAKPQPSEKKKDADE